MQQLYFDNLGLVYCIAGSLRLSEFDRGDILQIAYLALDKAVKVYRFDSEYTFVAYYRRCLVHEIYLHTLLMKYPFRVSHQEYKRLKQQEQQPVLLLGNGLECADQTDLSYASIDDAFIDVEHKILRESVWHVVESELTSENFFIISSLYRDGKTRRDLACILNIGYERVRMREIRSLRRLRKVAFLKEIAFDYFGIK